MQDIAGRNSHTRSHIYYWLDHEPRKVTLCHGVLRLSRNFSKARQYPPCWSVSAKISQHIVISQNRDINNHLPCEPHGNDLKTSLEGGTSDCSLLPVSLPPLFVAISHSVCIWFLGTTWYMSPLSMSIGSAFGIRGSLETESHFWRQMNEKIPIMGQPRTTPGSEVKVFSTMSAFICERCMK